MRNEAFKRKISKQNNLENTFFHKISTVLTDWLIDGKLQIVKLRWYIVVLGKELPNTSKNKNYKPKLTFRKKKYGKKIVDQNLHNQKALTLVCRKKELTY